MIEQLCQNLNTAQREAVEHCQGPLLVVAGAGSGKTRVLTARIAHLIATYGVAPNRIFAVTFTNKAAQEMKRRVGRLLGQDPGGLWIGTFHSLSARLLRREAPLLGFTRQFTIYDEDDRVSLIRRLMKERGLDTKSFSPRAVQSIISGAKNRMLAPAALEESAGFDRLVAVAAQVYHALGPALKAANAMDFDDLLLHPLAVFREHPDRLAMYQDRFQFILVDEFQDTNGAQYDLVRLLGQHGNVCAVGDDDQSIYGWRGALVQNMIDFQSDFPRTTVIRLEENYRSTQLILDAANHVIADNVGRLGKTLFTRRTGGERVTVVASADERDEAEWLVREFVAIEAESWKETEGTSISQRGVEEFYHDLTRTLVEEGWFRPFWLNLDGKMIGFIYGAAFRDTYFALKTSYIRAHSKLSPGIQLFREAVEDAFRSGLSRFDFVGQTSRWKEDWATGSLEHVDLRFYRSGLAGLADHLIDTQAKPLVRKLRQRGS